MTATLPSGGDYPDDAKPKEANTLRFWTVNPKRTAERLDGPLTVYRREDTPRQPRDSRRPRAASASRSFAAARGAPRHGASGRGASAPPDLCSAALVARPPRGRTATASVATRRRPRTRVVGERCDGAGAYSAGGWRGRLSRPCGSSKPRSTSSGAWVRRFGEPGEA